MHLEQVSPADAAALLRARDDVVLLDVREPEELALAAVPGALHLPLGDVPARAAELDPEREYLVLCHHGVRSAHAALFLLRQGFRRVRNVTGGIEEWARTVDPGVGRY